jgi:hypothetical protein
VRSGIQFRQDSLARLERVEPHIVAMDTRVGSAECGRERRQLTEQLDPNESPPITTTVSCRRRIAALGPPVRALERSIR